MISSDKSLTLEPTMPSQKSIQTNTEHVYATELPGSDHHENGDLSEIHEDEVEYPSGAKLAFIVVALFLSIFLASLDMVCVNSAVQLQHNLLTSSDHSRHGNPKNH
jgi:hypothetical protein